MEFRKEVGRSTVRNWDRGRGPFLLAYDPLVFDLEARDVAKESPKRL